MPSASRIGVPFGKRDVATLGEARERRHQQPFLAKCRPVALRILEKFVALRDPERLAAALAPVVEQDPGRLAAFARASTVAEEEAATEADSFCSFVGRGRDHGAGFIDGPRPREIGAMRLARVDHCLELGVRKEAIAQNGSGQFGTIGGFGGRNGRHGRRLHQLGRVRGRAGDVDRLQAEGLVDCIGQARSAKVVRRFAQGVDKVLSIRRGHMSIGLRRRRCTRFPSRGARRTDRNSREGGRGAGSSDIACIKREARGDLGHDPGEELRHIGSHGLGQIGGDATPLTTPALVEDRDTGLEAGAVLGKGGSGHSAGEDQMGTLGQAAEGLGPGGRIRCEAGAGDRDQSPARGQPSKRRAQMAGCRLVRPAIDIGNGREGRVHQDDAGALARVEMIVNLCGVEPADGSPRKEETQKIGARVGQLVQRETAARDLGKDRQQPGPGRRLEDQFARRDLCGSQRCHPHGQRCRELLEALHFF